MYVKRMVTSKIIFVLGTTSRAKRDASIGEFERLAGERLLVWKGTSESDDAVGRSHDADSTAVIDGESAFTR